MTKPTYHLPKKFARNLTDAYRILNMCLGLPVTRKNDTIPFGYKQSETDPDMLDPIDSEFEVYYKASRFISQHHSLSEVIEWVAYHTGRKMSKQGFYDMLKVRPPMKECLLPLNERMKLGVDFYALRELQHKEYEENERRFSIPEVLLKEQSKSSEETDSTA